MRVKHGSNVLMVRRPKGYDWRVIDFEFSRFKRLA